MFSFPDNNLLELSCHTVSSCQLEDDDVRVIDIKSILGVVGMVPHKPTLLSGVTEDCYFMVEKPGLDIVMFGVPYEGPAAQLDQLDEQEAEAGEDDGDEAGFVVLEVSGEALYMDVEGKETIVQVDYGGEEFNANGTKSKAERQNSKKPEHTKCVCDIHIPQCCSDKELLIHHDLTMPAAPASAGM
ncbi:hypothetical protein EV702DRAFT_1201970 [Suillus placidus]|uniref:Uncharacterized protein n=1 Tax=Suillus placidus TaxID=48579 RepID=A0A9P7CYS4_9AGAM|nr:hypothetical protein EV702DRAFT_1201970 [Suillus placidus]